MKQRIAHAAVIVALVVAALLLRYRGASAPGADLPPTPEQCVNALFDAAEQSDDVAYLALVRGELARTLRATRDRDPEAFRENLRRSAADLQGLAVSPGAGASYPDVALDVELVFKDRNERQRMVVRPEGGGWAVTSLGSATTTRPAVRYGTPVFQE